MTTAAAAAVFVAFLPPLLFVAWDAARLLAADAVDDAAVLLLDVEPVDGGDCGEIAAATVRGGAVDLFVVVVVAPAAEVLLDFVPNMAFFALANSELDANFLCWFGVCSRLRTFVCVFECE